MLDTDVADDPEAFAGAPLPDCEIDRLGVLRGLEVLDSAPEAVYDRITALVRELLQVEYCVISLVDSDRQWFKSVAGALQPRETTRKASFCAWSIHEQSTLVVDDTLRDPRFASNPLVLGAPYIRFYAGAPLVVNGQALGTLCVFDSTPRSLTHVQSRILHALSDTVAELLRLRSVGREAALLGQLLEGAVEEAYLFDLAQQKILYASPGALRRLGLDSAQVRQRRPVDLSELYTREVVERAFADPGFRGPRVVLEATHPDAQGRRYAVSSLVTRAGPQASQALFVVVARNIEEQKQAQRELAYMAHHDALTGLANRYLLEERFHSASQRARRAGQSLGIIVIDLDGFKQVNDTLGHQAGDEVLVHTAQTLTASVRETDTVARLGGDEFVILLDRIEPDSEADDIAARVGHELSSRPCPVLQAPVAFSLGLALGTASTDLDQLMAEADTRMYEHKQRVR